MHDRVGQGTFVGYHHAHAKVEPAFFAGALIEIDVRRMLHRFAVELWPFAIHLHEPEVAGDAQRHRGTDHTHQRQHRANSIRSTI